MSSQATRQNIYQQKINSLIGNVNSLRHQLSRSEGRITETDDTLSKLPGRISAIRRMNYRIQSSFEKDQAVMTTKWAELGPSLRTEYLGRMSSINKELTALELEIQARRFDTSLDPRSLTEIESRLNSTRSMVSDYGSRIEGALAPLTGVLKPLIQGICEAEEVVRLTSAASFQWMEGETPIVSTHAKDMGEKTEGVLTLTNLRIIYESVKEVALKKTLFIVTEKKIERNPVLTKPIGSIKSLTKGSVGFLAGAGLYVDFKDDGQMLKLDTKSEEADRVVRKHSLIASGQVDDELKTLTPNTPDKAAKVVACPKCGAPYTEEIYRGQKTVRCGYCSTVITVE